MRTHKQSLLEIARDLLYSKEPSILELVSTLENEYKIEVRNEKDIKMDLFSSGIYPNPTAMYIDFIISLDHGLPSSPFRKRCYSKLPQR